MWLSWVEQRMVSSIHNETEVAYKSYTKEDQTRSDFILGRCGMAVLGIAMAFWTHNTE